MRVLQSRLISAAIAFKGRCCVESSIASSLMVIVSVDRRGLIFDFTRERDQGYFRLWSHLRPNTGKFRNYVANTPSRSLGGDPSDARSVLACNRSATLNALSGTAQLPFTVQEKRHFG